MFSIFKRSGKYQVPSLKPFDSAVGKKKDGKKTKAEKEKEASEKLTLAKKNGTEKMLTKNKTSKEKASNGEKLPTITPPEEAGQIPPK